MSLLFTASSTNKAEYTIPSGAVNLVNWTIWAWIYPTSLANGLGIWQQDQGGTTAGFRTLAVRSTGQIDLEMDMDVADVSVRTDTSNQITTNNWWFIAGSVETSGANLVGRIYIGSPTSLITEVSGYTTQQNGNNNRVTDSGGTGRWGARGSAQSLAFGGRIAVGGLENTNVSIGILRSLQFFPRKLSTTQLYHVLGFNGTGTQPDLSGNLANATVTGATAAPHVPLGPPFGFEVGLPYVVTAGATNLVIQNASHAHSAANVVLTQTHELAIQNASHSHTAGNLTLDSAQNLVVQNAAHAHTADSLALTQTHVLTVQNASHSHTAENAVLTQTHVLTVSNASHAHTAENLVLVAGAAGGVKAPFLSVFGLSGVSTAVTVDQEGFRWRNDNGSESTATWAASQDVNHSVAEQTTVRLRVLINGTNDPAAAQYRLEYRVAGSSDSWSVIS